MMLLLLAVVTVGWAQPAVQRPKRIYITLDVSGSMEGNKYIMANYAAQSISVFSDPNDRVYLYYLGKRHDISGSDGYKQIQKPYNSLLGQKRYHEISDLIQFLKDYHADAHYQDWIFIIGDGQWNYYGATAEYEQTIPAFKQVVEKGNLQVCYLQTGNTLTEKYAFTTFLESLNSPVVDIKMSDTTATSVLGHCVYFANRILGFSNTNVELRQTDGQHVMFQSEFPLERCLLVYQSSQPIANETKIVEATCKATSLSVKVKGNPSTKPLVPVGKPVVNGMVWELSSGQTMLANDTVVIGFNQEVDAQNLKLYPYVDVALVMRPWTVEKDTLEVAAPNHYYLCDREEQVLVKMAATDKLGHKFPPQLMRRMEVKFNVMGREVSTTYSSSDSTVQAVLEMPGDTLTYFALVDCPGYFSRISPKQMVVKSAEVCPPERVPLITLPEQCFEAVSFESLREGREAVGWVDDSLFRAVAGAGLFDELLLSGHDSWMLETSSLSFEDGKIGLMQRPRHGLCECAFPEALCYKVTLRSRQGILYDGKLYEGFVVPVRVPVGKRDWWNRCWVYLAASVGLLLLLVYVRALKKKHRFGKSAGIKSIYFDRYGDEVDDNYRLPLRKEGVGAWLARWFWPGNERSSLSFIDPEIASMTFVAGESINSVNISSGSIDPSMIRVDGYDFENENKLPDTIKLSNNGRVEVYKNQEVKAGYLLYVAGEKTGEGGFRLLSSLLMLAVLAAEGFVIWILIKSLFGL